MSNDRRTRISPFEDISVRLRPLRRAENLNDFFLYWIPVSVNPIPVDQQAWLNLFLDRVSEFLQKQGLRSEVFLQYKTMYPSLLDEFLDHSLKMMPIMGFGYKPGVSLPTPPSNEEIKRLSERLIAGEPFDFGSYVGDFVYWFLGKNERKQRECFFGHGGLTLIFLPPDASTAPPKLPFSPRIKEHPAFRELFERVDVEQSLAMGQGLGDKWMKASKDLYAATLPKSPTTKHVPFVLPLLKASNFMNEPQERERLSALCDFYINESVEDRGILLASKNDYQDGLIEILESMRDSRLEYPAR